MTLTIPLWLYLLVMVGNVLSLIVRCVRDVRTTRTRWRTAGPMSNTFEAVSFMVLVPLMLCFGSLFGVLMVFAWIQGQIPYDR
ncbi:MAG: hypothetical protein Rubg2KO_15400 [Rubricoccaceae bacterium]